MPSINSNKLDTECIIPSGTEDGKKVLRSKENIWNDETISQKKNIAKVTLLEVIKADIHCYMGQHSVDIAYVLSTVNQIRGMLGEQQRPWRQLLVTALLALSILIQTVASALQLAEQNTQHQCKRKKYTIHEIYIFTVLMCDLNSIC